ncbi:MAG: hypothetical protein AAF220_12910, partial [Pseudomonadota bacterium]
VGLGTRFLGHAERCGVILHLVDGSQEDVAAAYTTVRHELDTYGAGLEDKAEIVGLNKIDALDDETRAARAAELAKACGKTPMMLSGVSGEGVTDVLRALLVEVDAHRALQASADEAAAEEREGLLIRTSQNSSDEWNAHPSADTQRERGQKWSPLSSSN